MGEGRKRERMVVPGWTVREDGSRNKVAVGHARGGKIAGSVVQELGSHL